jgi:SecD/SecF fusion protein
MLNVFGNLKIKFLDWSKPAFIVSWIIVLVGSLYGFSRGSDVFGVEFKGGDYILYEFAEKVDVDEIRPAIAEAAKGGTLIQYQKDLSSGLERLSITSAFETGLDVEKALKAAFPDSDFKNVGAVATGPQVSREILRAALVAMLLALFGILVYVAFRYEFSFAVGAVVAVLHDVFMTLGIFCMVGGEFTAPMVAAILTIVGFSINDTIVIFDRIREYLKLGMGGSFKDIMNYALNKTFARTIITSGTLFLAVVALYIFGGGVIHDFAFTLIVGVITGTYSSIYIAGSLVLWWHKGSKPKLATNTTATIDVAQAAA